MQPVFDTIVATRRALCGSTQRRSVSAIDGERLHSPRPQRVARTGRRLCDAVPAAPLGRAVSGRVDPDDRRSLTSTTRCSGSPIRPRACARQSASDCMLGGRCCGKDAASARSSSSRAKSGPSRRKQIDAAQDLRRPGGDRDRERAALQRAAGPQPRPDRIARAADRDRRDPAGPQRLADRHATGVRCHPAKGDRVVRGRNGRAPALRRRGLPPARPADSRPCVRRCHDEAQATPARLDDRARPGWSASDDRCISPTCSTTPPTATGSRRGWQAVEIGGMRTWVGVPMLKDGDVVGGIMAYRKEKRPFDEQADRAAADLRRPGGDRDRERAAFQRDEGGARPAQRASAEVLQVISSSVADTKPVFETILESCERLFEGRFAGVGLVGHDGVVHLGAYHGPGAGGARATLPGSAQRGIRLRAWRSCSDASSTIPTSRAVRMCPSTCGAEPGSRVTSRSSWRRCYGRVEA